MAKGYVGVGGRSIFTSRPDSRENPPPHMRPQRTRELSAKPQDFLAPAAGRGIGRQIADALIADSEFIGLMVAAFKDALTAHSSHFDKESKLWVAEVDAKTRLSAAEAILAHMEGEPVKRIITQAIGEVEKAPDVAAVLRDLQAQGMDLKGVVESYVAQLGPGPAPVVEVEARPTEPESIELP